MNSLRLFADKAGGRLLIRPSMYPRNISVELIKRSVSLIIGTRLSALWLSAFWPLALGSRLSFPFGSWHPALSALGSITFSSLWLPVLWLFIADALREIGLYEITAFHS